MKNLLKLINNMRNKYSMEVKEISHSGVFESIECRFPGTYVVFDTEMYATLYIDTIYNEYEYYDDVASKVVRDQLKHLNDMIPADIMGAQIFLVQTFEFMQKYSNILHSDGKLYIEEKLEK